MKRPLTTLERAFELARSGDCAGVKEIRLRLRREGYDERRDLYGRSLVRQLIDLCNEARVERIAAAGRAEAAAPLSRWRKDGEARPGAEPLQRG